MTLPHDNSPAAFAPGKITTAVVTCLYSSKGGVGKTTMCCNLAAFLADIGYKTLIIDTDQQQSANNFYDISKPSKGGLVELVRSTLPLDDCISKTTIDNLDIVLANDSDDRTLRTWVRGASQRGTALKEHMPALKEKYDFIFLDTIGTDGSGDTQELALRAADIILFPITADAVETRESFNNGFRILQNHMPRDPQDTYRRIPIPHVLVYKYNPDIPLHMEYVDGIEELVTEMQIEEQAILLKTRVPYSRVYNAAQAGTRTPVHKFDPRRRSSTQKKPCAAECLANLTQELYGVPVPPAEHYRFRPKETHLTVLATK